MAGDTLRRCVWFVQCMFKHSATYWVNMWLSLSMMRVQRPVAKLYPVHYLTWLATTDSSNDALRMMCLVWYICICSNGHVINAHGCNDTLLVIHSKARTLILMWSSHAAFFEMRSLSLAIISARISAEVVKLERLYSSGMKPYLVSSHRCCRLLYSRRWWCSMRFRPRISFRSRDLPSLSTTSGAQWTDFLGWGSEIRRPSRAFERSSIWEIIVKVYPIKWKAMFEIEYRLNELQSDEKEGRRKWKWREEGVDLCTTKETKGLNCQNGIIDCVFW